MLAKILRDAIFVTSFLAMALSLPLSAYAADHKLMLYGDSLMAGLGLPEQEGFAAQLNAALDNDHVEVDIINASVSGDTSAAALNRLDWSLADRPNAVLLGLGGNDMLQGLSPSDMETNLRSILQRLKAENIPVLLLGMRASPGLGADYVRDFDQVFTDLADEFEVPLYPFFLEGVALNPELNQADGIHPNAAGVRAIVAAVLPQVEQLLEQ